MDNVVSLARSNQDIQGCFEVMVQMRPHLKREEFVARVRRQQAEARYELAYLTVGGVKAVAGFRILSAWRGASFFMLTILSPGVATDRRAMVEICSTGL